MNAGGGGDGGGAGNPCGSQCTLVPWLYQTILYMGTLLSPATSLLHHLLEPFHYPFSVTKMLVKKNDCWIIVLSGSFEKLFSSFGWIACLIYCLGCRKYANVLRQEKSAYLNFENIRYETSIACHICICYFQAKSI